MYAELYAPVLKNLELTAALRFDDYSDFGNTTNPKFGVKWTVVPQLVARGTYTMGFRAPGPYESGNSAAAGFTSYRDPVRCPVTNNPADCGNGQVVAITSGNPNVEPETSTNWTVGLIWEPVPQFNASIDYWNIEIKDQIVGSDPQSVIDNPSGFPSATLVRDTNNLPGIANSGTVLAVSAPYANADNTKTDGIDITAALAPAVEGVRQPHDHARVDAHHELQAHTRERYVERVRGYARTDVAVERGGYAAGPCQPRPSHGIAVRGSSPVPFAMSAGWTTSSRKSRTSA